VVLTLMPQLFLNRWFAVLNVSVLLPYIFYFLAVSVIALLEQIFKHVWLIVGHQ